MTTDTQNSSIKFKKLFLFYLASTALLISGALYTKELDWQILLFLVYCNFNGVFLIYRLNDCIDQHKDLKLNLKSFFDYKLHQWMVIQFLVILIPLAFLLLPAFSLYTLVIGGVVGSFYSLSFNIGKKQFRIKNVFLVKNILIGLVWGALVLVGAGHISTEEVMVLFGFASIQVVIGSMIRDVPDIEKDRSSGVKSLPVVLGIPFTFSFMHSLNVLGLLLLYLLDWNSLWLAGFGAVVIWRAINLIMLQKDNESRFWGQTFNLLACVFIFLVTLIFRFYGDY